MAEPFLAEVRVFSFGFAPKGWATCDGQFLPINQNQALFSLLGTQFGGNGQTTFALPDLRGRVPIHVGSNIIGQGGGEQAHTVSTTEMPTHIHVGSCTGDDATSGVPTNNLLARSTNFIYGGANNLTSLTPSSITSVGGSQAHDNMQPYLTLNFAIALQGIFPSPN